jgi:glycosyltransferase involved in cell wall biosynthesis
LTEDIKSQFKLVIAGKTCTELYKLKDLVTELKEVNNIIFLENVEHHIDLSLYAHASYFVLSSINEGFGLALLEAAMFDIPIISTNVGGCPEFITHNENGILVNANAPQELTSAMTDVILNKDFSKQLATNCRKKVAMFTWENSLKNYLNIINLN